MFLIVLFFTSELCLVPDRLMQINDDDENDVARRKTTSVKCMRASYFRRDITLITLLEISHACGYSHGMHDAL